jgi:serine protease Do
MKFTYLYCYILCFLLVSYCGVLVFAEEKSLPLQGNPTPDFDSDLVERLFLEAREGIFQIKISKTASSPKASYGTAFAVDTRGLLVTNYHVVAPLFFTPPESPLSLFILTKTGPLLAQVVTLDLVHDLALISIPNKLKRSLRLASTVPRKGQKIYSIGIPKDLNVSLVEATSNGLLTYGPYEQLHMSGPINGGMSGGPTLNRYGEVVGVNVSYLLNAQNISFSIPVSYVRKLLSSRLSKSSLFLADIQHPQHFLFMEQQLLRVQESFIKELKKQTHRSTLLDDWSIMTPPDLMKCWSTFRNESTQLLSLTTQSCAVGGKTFMKEGLSLGDFDWQMTVFKNKNRSFLPFYFFLHQAYNHEFKTMPYLFDSKKRCLEWSGLNRHHIRITMNVCLRSLPRFPSLFMMNAKWMAFPPDIPGIPSQVLMMKTQVRGFSAEGIKKYLAFHMDALNFTAGGGTIIER